MQRSNRQPPLSMLMEAPEMKEMELIPPGLFRVRFNCCNEKKQQRKAAQMERGRGIVCFGKHLEFKQQPLIPM